MAVALDFDAMVPHRANAAGMAAPSRSPAPGPRSTHSPSCVVVTGDVALRRRLVAAAELAGWDVDVVPIDAEAPLAPVADGCRLLVVDIATPPACGRAAIDRFTAGFMERRQGLLVVCGSADEVGHERWSRTSGAFLHVPGVAPGDSLLGWFLEARTVIERDRPQSLRPSLRRAMHPSS